MDSRIEELAQIIIERCEDRGSNIDVTMCDPDEADILRTYMWIRTHALTIKGYLDQYRDRHPEMYK